MKSKLVNFQQHLYHEIEDEDKSADYIEKALPIIGVVVMYFNSLERALDSVLCQNFTDRSDSMGLIVLKNLTYSTKVDLFVRFCDDFHFASSSVVGGYEKLIADLRESGRLRNLVVHANWESTDESGYTYVKMKISKIGMQQEYVQFTVASLNKIAELIVLTRNDLYDFWEKRNDALYGR